LASRAQACSRSARGAITLSMPASVTPRRMKAHHRARQVHALGQAAGRHDAAVAGLRQRIDQRVAAHRVDHAGPALLLQRLAGRGQFGAVDHSAAPSACR
jgi:hypothetical protein